MSIALVDLAAADPRIQILRPGQNARQQEDARMTDDLTKRRPQDAEKVNVNEPWEITYWTKAFSCTEAQLRAAVKAVGVQKAAVKAYLASRR